MSLKGMRLIAQCIQLESGASKQFDQGECWVQGKFHHQLAVGSWTNCLHFLSCNFFVYTNEGHGPLLRGIYIHI